MADVNLLLIEKCSTGRWDVVAQGSEEEMAAARAGVRVDKENNICDVGVVQLTGDASAAVDTYQTKTASPLKKCPAGTVLQKSEGAVHHDVAEICMEKTEVPQKPYMDFLKDRFPKEYAKVSNLLASGLQTVVGDNKPAVYATWEMAREYCRFKYPDGDLPTERQWENACGSGRYCTASGEELNHQEAIYDVNGPADVDGPGADKRVNKRGIQDMTGNVWEWMKDDAFLGAKRFRGGSWVSGNYDVLHADFRFNRDPGYRNFNVGIRCVAPALSPVEGPPQ